MTKDTIARIIAEHGAIVSSSDIARRYKISVPTEQRLFRKVSPASMQLDEAIFIDEFKGDVGAKFQVAINSLTRHCCLNILADRTSEILYQQLLEYPLEERLKVKLVSICDIQWICANLTYIEYFTLLQPREELLKIC